MLYTTPNCTFCEEVKKFLEKQKQKFEIIDILQFPEARDFLIKKGFMGVPVIDINGVFIQGLDKSAILEALKQ